MKLTIKLFAILLIVAGISLLFSPEFIFDFIDGNKHSISLYIFAIVVRLVMGVVLILSAKESMYPTAIKVLGFLFIIVAGILIVIGQSGMQDLISSLFPVFQSFAALVGMLAIAFSSFLLYAFSGRKKK